MGLAAHCAGPWAAAAVGGGKGFVQVHVDAVKAHVAGPHHPHDGVQVGPVIVAQAAGPMDQPGDLQDIFIEDAHGIGVGEHQACGILSQHPFEGLQVHAAVGGGGDVHHRVPAHIGGGRVGAMGGIRHDDLGALPVSPGIMIGLDQHYAGKLPVGAGSGLEGHIVHAGDLA